MPGRTTASQKPDTWTIRQLRVVAQYQFGTKFDKILVPKDIMVTFSKTTKKIREVQLDGK
ncbi:MAG: hypothetical protein ACTSSH_05220, partial [Candidatus Heimdallarchaeota archaeon]